MQLRDYQETFVSNVARSLATHRKVCAQLATGAGKTVVFSAIAQRYIAKQAGSANPLSVLILVHRKELLAQTRRTLYNAYNIIAQPIQAGMKTIPPAEVYVGMCESAHRRAAKLRNIGMVIIDEAHIAAFNKLHDVFPDQYILGFTATPLSASVKCPMSTHYEQIITGIDIPELIAAGNLCQCITYAPRDTVDRAALVTKGNEFEESEMAKEFSKSRHVMNTVRAYEQHSKGAKTIVFNVQVEHSKKVCDAFIQSGYNARHIDGMTDAGMRTATLRWFSETPDAILCNVGIATTGFDEPTIETVIVNRATQSLPLYLQMCGRGARPTPTKASFTIIDMGSNASFLGEWHNPRDWGDMFRNPRKKSDKEGVAPVKSCPQCEALVAVSARICQYCEFEIPKTAAEEAQEELFSELVCLTQGIDVAALIERNAEKKQYAAFFQIANALVAEATRMTQKMSDSMAGLLLEQYHAKGREWCKAVGKRYNQWHQERAQETLWAKLKERFGWEPVADGEAVPA